MAYAVHRHASGINNMAERKSGKAFESTRVSKFISDRLDEIAPRKSQRIVARAVGYPKPNVISMIKSGEMKVPFEKVPLLAEALEVDPAHLFRLALEQYWPDMQQTISQIFGNVVSENEMAIIRHVRKASGERDPSLTKELKDKIQEVFAR